MPTMVIDGATIAAEAEGRQIDGLADRIDQAEAVGEPAGQRLVDHRDVGRAGPIVG